MENEILIELCHHLYGLIAVFWKLSSTFLAVSSVYLQLRLILIMLLVSKFLFSPYMFAKSLLFFFSCLFCEYVNDFKAKWFKWFMWELQCLRALCQHSWGLAINHRLGTPWECIIFFIEGMESMVKSKQEKNLAKLQREKIVHS